jgi:hypothetical protein
LLAPRIGLGELVHVVNVLVCGHCAAPLRKRFRD